MALLAALLFLALYLQLLISSDEDGFTIEVHSLGGESYLLRNCEKLMGGKELYDKMPENETAYAFVLLRGTEIIERRMLYQFEKDDKLTCYTTLFRDIKYPDSPGFNKEVNLRNILNFFEHNIDQ